MCCLLLSMCTHHVSLIFVHIATVFIFSHSLSLFSGLLLSLCPCFLLSVITLRGKLCTFWRWIKCFLLSLCYFNSPHIHSVCLPPSVGYMWACLHDRRNAKSSPDHYNMPCVHNLHEIHIHSWDACTRNSFFLLLPDSLMLSTQSLCSFRMCSIQKVFQMKTLVSLMSLISYKVACVAFYLVIYFTHNCT